MNANSYPVWYSVEPDGDPNAPRFPIKHNTSYTASQAVSLGGECLAEEAAQDYFENHDGWESEWPLLIVLYDGPTGNELDRYTVNLHHDPEFHASKAPPPETP